MEASKKKVSMTIVGLALAIVLTAGLIVGGTFALFTTRETVNNHIVSGNLDVGLYLTSLQYDEIDDQGLISPSKSQPINTWNTDGSSTGNDTDGTAWLDTGIKTTLTKGVDLSVFHDEVFTINNAVPTMTGVAEFVIVNRSTIAVNYAPTIVNVKMWRIATDDDALDTIVDGYVLMTQAESDAAAEYLIIKNNFKGGSVLARGDANVQYSDFSVTFEFVDDGADWTQDKAPADEDGVVTPDHTEDSEDNSNNKMMNKKVTFDIQVAATQVTAYTELTREGDWGGATPALDATNYGSVIEFGNRTTAQTIAYYDEGAVYTEGTDPVIKNEAGNYVAVKVKAPNGVTANTTADSIEKGLFNVSTLVGGFTYYTTAVDADDNSFIVYLKVAANADDPATTENEAETVAISSYTFTVQWNEKTTINYSVVIANGTKLSTTPVVTP